MKLHVIPGAPNCRKVQAVAFELGFELELVPMSFRDGDAAKSDYLAINPNGYTPTLVDGDLALWESNAINQYLCDRKPGNTLFPSKPAIRADIARWQFWEAANLQRVIYTYFRENFLKPKYLGVVADPARINEQTGPFHKFASILDAHLRGRRYMVGEQLTLADFSLAASFCYAGPALLPWENYGEIRRWYAQIDALPAWQATAPRRAA